MYQPGPELMTDCNRASLLGLGVGRLQRQIENGFS
jgi:hypothetical protein